MNTKKIHRRYPTQDWDYKAISIIYNDKGTKRDVIYYTLYSKGKKTEGVEIYTGENYIAGSKDKSSSRVYKINNFPEKYNDIVAELKKTHKSSKWSSDKYVNEN